MSKPAAEHDEFADIRESVRALCAKFPGEYWRALDRERAYPTEFVAAVTRSRLSRRADPGRVWRQRAFDRRSRGDPGGNPRRRLQRRRLPRPDVHHGHHPAARLARAEAKLSAEDRQRRIAPASLRRDRADLGHRHAVFAHHGEARRQRPLRHQRPEDLDLARRAFRPDAAAGAHRAEGEGQETHRRPVGVPGGHAARARHQHHHQSDPHHDEPRHHGGVLRRPARAGGKSDRRGGRGLPLHSRRHERRAHFDRGGMHRRRQMVHRQGDKPMPRSANCSAGRSGRTRACSFRSRAPMRRCAPPN